MVLLYRTHVNYCPYYEAILISDAVGLSEIIAHTGKGMQFIYNSYNQIDLFRILVIVLSFCMAEKHGVYLDYGWKRDGEATDCAESEGIPEGLVSDKEGDEAEYGAEYS